MNEMATFSTEHSGSTGEFWMFFYIILMQFSFGNGFHHTACKTGNKPIEISPWKVYNPEKNGNAYRLIMTNHHEIPPKYLQHIDGNPFNIHVFPFRTYWKRVGMWHETSHISPHFGWKSHQTTLWRWVGLFSQLACLHYYAWGAVWWWFCSDLNRHPF